MLSNYNTLQTRQIVARVLLIATVGVIVGCVLPPPPREKPGELAPLALNFKTVAPVAPQQDLFRKFGESITFSVQNAVTPPERQPNFFWYVDFKNESPQLHDQQGDPFTLEGCSELVGGDSTKTVIVEVLITEGIVTVDLDSQDGEDPRVTVNQEPIIKHTWVVTVNGPGAEDCEPPATIRGGT